jgi:Xaa-Pro dipeptidase
LLFVRRDVLALIEIINRQRRPFVYLSGCLLPDALLTYHIASDELTLYIPPLDPESVIWSGLPLSPTQAQQLYDVDRVLLTTEINPTLAHLGSLVGSKGVVYAIPEQVSEGITFLPFSDTEFSILKEAIEETRAIKDQYEIALIRKANDITAQAHTAVLKAAKSATNERELEAAFIGTCIANGCREQAYHPIVASGTSSATLHYVSNDDPLVEPATKKKKLNLLLDAAGEYRAYCADVTRTFPLSGKFSPESRQIYDVVLQMQLESLSIIKEGVLWEDVHTLAHRIAIRGLLKLGILRGTEEELFEKRISVAFLPHGLGHYLGMDTHDTGGHANYADKDPMFRYLRVRGKLPAGSVITVEPGVCVLSLDSSIWPAFEAFRYTNIRFGFGLTMSQIYFCRFIIEPFLNNPDLAKYIDSNILEKYWEVGGVRIEDNVHVTKTGYENLTSAPKTADEVELLITG